MPHPRRVFSILALVAALCVAGPGAAFGQQEVSIADARDAGGGSTVTVTGTVTRAFGDFVRFQDESGPTGASGLVIRQAEGGFAQDVSDGTIASGTVLRVTGTLSSFRGLLQINGGDLDSYSIEGTGDVPAPQDVTLATLNADGEDYESELVRVTGISLEGVGTAFEADRTYTATDGSTTFDFRVQGSDESALPRRDAPQGAFTYVGVVGQFDPNPPETSGYQLIPVRTTDLRPALSFVFRRGFRVVQEDAGSVPIAVRATNVPDGQTVEVSVSTSGGTGTQGEDVTGFSDPTTLSFTGPDPAPRSFSVTVADDAQDEGAEYLTFDLASQDGTTAGEFDLWILDDTTATATLYPDLEGNALLDRLTTDFGNPPTLGYDVARDTLYRRVFNENGVVRSYYANLEVTVDPDGGDASNQALDQNVNTEHTYPQSLGAGDEPQRSNMHILVPARDVVNSARSNYPFGDVPDDLTDEWFFQDTSVETAPPASERDRYSEVDDSPVDRDDRRFEPRESVKGNVARKVLYFRAAYPNETSSPFFDTQLATLLAWNQQDPPDSLETVRNVVVAAYQGNALNPFVIDPSLADRIFAPGGVFIPTEFRVDASARFGGLDDPASYRLVALAGDVSRSIGSTLDGAAATDWRVFWDDGSDDDFLIPYESSPTFQFAPGRGFWLLSRDAWRVSTTVSSVALNADTEATIPLHDGWNIISNPLDRDVAWSDVEAANGGALQALWGWDGQFSEQTTFASARSGVAYYFLNDGGLSALTIPYPTGATSSTTAKADPENASTLTFTASSGERTATAQVRFRRDASAGLDAYDQVTPPGAFETVRVRLKAPARDDASARTSWLARDVRPFSDDGHTLTLAVTPHESEPVRLSVAGLDALLGTEVALVHPVTGRRYDLTTGAVTLPGDGATAYTLLVGPTEFIDAQAASALPREVALAPVAPNPVRHQTTVQYDLPDAAPVSLALYDVLGRRVATLVDARRPAGRHDVTWSPDALPSGVYFLRLAAADQVLTRKLVVVR